MVFGLSVVPVENHGQDGQSFAFQGVFAIGLAKLLGCSETSPRQANLPRVTGVDVAFVVDAGGAIVGLGFQAYGSLDGEGVFVSHVTVAMEGDVLVGRFRDLGKFGGCRHLDPNVVQVVGGAVMNLPEESITSERDEKLDQI